MVAERLTTSKSEGLLRNSGKESCLDCYHLCKFLMRRSTYRTCWYLSLPHCRDIDLWINSFITKVPPSLSCKTPWPSLHILTFTETWTFCCSDWKKKSVSVGLILYFISMSSVSNPSKLLQFDFMNGETEAQLLGGEHNYGTAGEQSSHSVWLSGHCWV